MSQAAVDALLPATVNRIACRRCINVPKVLVISASDRQPPTFNVYNRDTRALTPIAASRPWIKAQAMGIRDVHRFAARDGLSIPVLDLVPGEAAGDFNGQGFIVWGGEVMLVAGWHILNQISKPNAAFTAPGGTSLRAAEFQKASSISSTSLIEAPTGSNAAACSSVITSPVHAWLA